MLLVAHGTRRRGGLAEVRQIAALVRDRLPGVPVALSFLELARPTPAEGLARLAAAGVAEVVVTPLLLFRAGHAKRDIPTAAREAAAKLGVGLQYADPLELHPCVLRLSRERFCQALASREHRRRIATALVLVGRGSSDSQAVAAMRRFARARASQAPGVHVLHGFLARARPTLEDVLARAAAMPLMRVVVQPHLLFRGELTTSVERAVRAAARRWPEKEWLVAPHLGVSPLVARAVADRFADAARRARPSQRGRGTHRTAKRPNRAAARR
jgi:sirohydrochlorin cobaltochelatase